MVAQYADDVVFDGTEVSDGVYRGREAVRRHFGDISEALAYSHTGLEFHERGDRVAVTSSVRGRGSRSGLEATAELGYLFTVREGEVAEVRLFARAADAVAAAGATPSADRG